MIHTYDPEGNGLFFGFSVAVSGDFIAVGDPADNFEFKRNQGTLWCWARDQSAPARVDHAEAADAASGIPASCQGCGGELVVGRRYKCSECPNHRLEGDGVFMCTPCVDPSTKRMAVTLDPTRAAALGFHQASHAFWNVDEDPSSANHARFRKGNKTWTNHHGKTGGGLWERSEPLLQNGSRVAQSDRYQASGAPEWNDGVGLVFVRECNAVRNRERGLVQAPDTVNVPPARTAGYRFGASVDLQWPLLAVGAPGHTQGAGSAYLFLYQGGAWAPLGERLCPVRDKDGARFGASVALCGAAVLVGAPAGPASAGTVRFRHVSEAGSGAFSEQEAAVLAQCVKARSGGSLPRGVFDQAVLKVAKQGGAPWPLARVMMVGEGRAGKTALRNALLGKEFVPTDSTIGIETLTLGRVGVSATGQGRWVEEIEVEWEGREVEMRERAVARACVDEMHKSSQVE